MVLFALLATGCRYRALVRIHVCKRGRHSRSSGQRGQEAEANTRASQNVSDFSRFSQCFLIDSFKNIRYK